MRHAVLAGLLLVISLALTENICGQVDELRAATGLPIAVGEPLVFGKVNIVGMPREQRRPSIYVSLFFGGSQIDRKPADGSGYYFFIETPRNGHMLVFEVDGNEVGRVHIVVGLDNRVRHDVSLDWRALTGAAKTQTGTIEAKPGYERAADAEKKFKRAMKAAEENKTKDALILFKELVDRDPNDYHAWTMLGTVYYSESNHSLAAEAFAKALELKPDLLYARINLGKLEMSQKNYDKAIEVLRVGADANPSSAEINHVLGEAYLRAKKGSLAVGYLNKAIELAPIEKAEIHLRLAALYNGAGLKDRAAAEYKFFLEKVKDHPDAKTFEQYIKENGNR
jgi:Tfp pilus assembly protein PilF